MSSFQHFILTRFNTRTSSDSNRIGISHDWLNHRFNLFEKFCYPSVCSQANQSFKWLVFFDADTPEVFKKKVEEYTTFSNFIPIYLKEEFSDSVNRQVLRDFLDICQPDYLITTRLDNDDAISYDFIEIIQSQFRRQTSEFISFKKGYVWYENQLYLFNYPNNPFISLIEKINPSDPQYQTVLCGDHTEISSIGRVQYIKSSPAWLQVIHDRNVANRVRGIRCPISKLSDHFTVAPELVVNHEPWLPYILDKSLTLLKAPVDASILAMPKKLRTHLRHSFNKVVLKKSFNFERASHGK